MIVTGVYVSTFQGTLQARWEQRRVSIRTPSESCRFVSLMVRPALAIMCTRSSTLQNKAGSQQWACTKIHAATLSLPWGHAFPRCQDTILYEPSCTERSPTRAERGNLDLWLVDHGRAQAWVSVSSELNTMKQKYELNFNNINWTS
jgi:hypothetical protein